MKGLSVLFTLALLLLSHQLAKHMGTGRKSPAESLAKPAVTLSNVTAEAARGARNPEARL